MLRPSGLGSWRIHYDRLVSRYLPALLRRKAGGARENNARTRSKPDASARGKRGVNRRTAFPGRPEVTLSISMRAEDYITDLDGLGRPSYVDDCLECHDGMASAIGGANRASALRLEASLEW